MTVHPSRGPRVAWLIVLFALCVFGFLAVDAIFVHTVWGQRTDNGALSGSVIGRARIIDRASTLLNVVSISALALATAGVALIGAVRRRPGLAVLGVTLLAGANISTQLLKKNLLQRPDLGVDGPQGFAHNTLPSGHTTVAISVVAALLFVVPPAVQGIVALLGGLGAAAMGIATLSAGWHRPSDAIAAYLVVGAWAAVLAAVAALLPGPAVPADRRTRPPLVAAGLLVVGAAAALAVGILALAAAGGVPLPTGRHHLLVEYGGGAAVIAGAAWAMSAVLLFVARATGQRSDPAATPPGPAEYDPRRSPLPAGW